MVLADSSVWIRFFMGREPWVSEMRRLLQLGHITGHDFVYGELLAGDSGGRRKNLPDYGLMRQAATISHPEVVGLVRAKACCGRGVGWIDLNLLASALAGHMQLWTADHALLALAREAGIDYKGPSVSKGLYLLPK